MKIIWIEDYFKNFTSRPITTSIQSKLKLLPVDFSFWFDLQEQILLHLKGCNFPA